MAKKIHSVLAIDIGGASLKMAEFSFPPSGNVVLEKFAFCDLEDRDGDPGTVFKEAYLKLLAEQKFKAKNVSLSISGQSSFSRLAKLPQLSGNSSAINRIISFEAQQIVPYPMNEIVWGYQLVSHTVKTEHVVESEDPAVPPVTETEESNEFEALFVAVKNDQITQYTDTIVDSGKTIISVDIAPVAMFNAARATQCNGEESTLLLNIGGRSTSLVISDGSRIFVRNIPIAGDAITQQVSKEFGISFAEAEELKQRHGFVALGGAYEEPESEVAATISKIARNIMTRLHGEITRSINVWRSLHGGNAPKRMLLAGGGALMVYTTEFFQEKLRIPVDFLNVFPALSLGSGVDRQQLLDVAPMFSELAGVSLHCVSKCPVDISLIPKSIQFQTAFQRKGLYFYISAAIVLICLVLLYAGVNTRTQYSRRVVEGTKGKVEETLKMQDRVRKLMGTYDQRKNEYNEVIGYLNQRGRWNGLMEELQSVMPDYMFVVALDGKGQMTEVQAAAPGGSEMMGMFDMPTPGSGRRRGGFDSQTAVQEKPKTGVTAELVRPDATRMTDVKELRLKMYALVFDRDLLEDDLRNALKKTKYFSDADDAFTIEAYESGKGVDNLKAFTVLLKLREPLKK